MNLTGFIFSIFFVIIHFFAIGQTYTLDQCINTALSFNPALKMADSKISLAETDLKIARNQYFPTVEAGLRRSYNWGLFIDPATNLLSNFSSQVNSASVYSETELINGGRIYYTIEQNRMTLLSAGMDKKAIEYNISLQTTQLYFTAYTLYVNLQRLDNEYSRSHDVLEWIRKKLSAGIASKLDELAAESDLKKIQVDRVVARNQYNLSLTQMATFIGLNSGHSFALDFSSYQNISAILQRPSVHLTDSLIPRPSILSIEYQLSSNRMAIKSLQAQKYPVLTAGAGLSTRSSSLLQTELGQQFSNNLSRVFLFNLRVPLFNRNYLNQNINKLKENEKILMVKMNEDKWKFERKKAAVLIELSNMIDEINARNDQLEILRRLVTATRQSYESGQISWYNFQLIRNQQSDMEGQIMKVKSEFIYKTELYKRFFSIY